MIISYQWLLDYLPEPVPVNVLSEILTSIGLEVESVDPIESIPGGLGGLIIGEVLTCAKHPNADKLSVTTVTTGGEILHIVCGAPNVAAGQKVIIAPAGATVHPTGGTPFLIKKAKIRGEESAGMICAEDEIGLGKSHAGIMILPADAPVGLAANVYFNIPKTDYAIHIGLTPNRSDANSHMGVARDVCAYLTHHREKKYAIVPPATQLPEARNSGQQITISILAPEACPRYAGITLSGIKVGPSPAWLQQRLQAIGVRSINNIVDVTNYVLHEFGQPLHAFDADKLSGNQINVRFADEGAPFIALDGKERKLSSEDLMICDAQNLLAIGGVFGGADSGINDNTTRIFIESAYFTPRYIRRTSLRHNQRTDAATHFEKGVDIGNVIPAMRRAATLILEIGGGAVESPVTDVYPVALPVTQVTVSYGYIRKLSGKEYKKLAIQEILTASGFHIEHESADALTLRVPSNKTDVSLPADIVEEILRIDGLDHIRIPDRLNISLTGSKPGDRKIRERVAGLLCGMGLSEIVTNSIVNSRYYPGNTTLVHMINSLSSELDVMRPSLLEGGLEVIQYNCNRKNNDLSLFEFGNIYSIHDGKYIQEARIGIWVTGNASPAGWTQKPQPADLFYLKGIIANLVSYAGFKNVELAYSDDEIAWKWNKQTICLVKKVTSRRLQEFDIKQEVAFAEINWDAWVKSSASVAITYREVPRFPSVQRDLALVLDQQVTYKEISDTTDQLKLTELQSYSLFDIFESEKLGKGKKSFALNYTFQVNDRTLTENEIEQLMSKLAETYKTRLNAQIRE